MIGILRTIMEFKRSPRPARSRAQAAAPSAAPPEQRTTDRPPTQHRTVTRPTKMRLNKRSGAGIAIVLVLCLLVLVAVNRHSSTPGPSPTSDATSQPSKDQAVLPNTKSIEELGGWKRVSPPESDPVFAYNDVVDGVAISVSQQPLPDSFKNNTASHVADLAKKFNATTTLKANGITAYLGNSSKGPQSVIFAKKDALIMIKSQNKISDKSWTTYLASLK